MSLESFFSIGSSAIASAQNTFTNRTSELDSFAATVESRRRAKVDAIATVENMVAPRTNVLVFYGLGGIGKSRLSRELQSRYLAEPVDAITRLTFRADFDSGDATDLESLLLGLRAALGTYRPVWPAFDLAFAAYWERAHPGTPMQVALNNSSAIRRASSGLQLGTQIQDAVEGLLDSPGGVLGIFAAGAKLVGRSVRDQIVQHRVADRCPFFRPVVGEPDPYVMRMYLAPLLAWDLADRQERVAGRGGLLELVVFMDTWERLQEGESHRGDTEDILSRLVYLMPNTLFVVTGRNQLRWADEDRRSRMQWAGPERWPYLADAIIDLEPRQHLVGNLSPSDADRFLTLRLQRAGEPVIPLEVRAVIVSAARGLPLYLDLAAVRYAQIVARGGIPGPRDFADSLPEVVLRIMRDLDPDQRVLLRMASMVARFDEDLLLAGSPRLADSALSEFVRRSIVQAHPNDYLPFGIHESLREAVHEADIADDRWSPREWAAVASRLSDRIRERTQPELDSSGRLDSGVLSGYFLDSFRLATCTGRVEPWMWQLAGRLHSRAVTSTLAAVAGVVPEGNVIRPATAVLRAVAERREAGPARTAETLAAVIHDPLLDETGRDYAGYWLAWQLDELDRWDEAANLRRRLSAGGGYFVPYLKHALARSNWVNGRLREASAAEFDPSDLLQRYWRDAIASRVAWISGRFAESDELCRRRIFSAEAIGSPEPLAHALRTLAEVRCFTAPQDEEPALAAIEAYQRLRVPVSEAETQVALQIARSDRQPLTETRSALAEAAAVLGTAPHADVAAVFVSCRAGKVGDARVARQRLVRTHRGTAYGYWIHITGWWIAESGGEVDDAAAPVEWRDGADAAQERWVAVLSR